MAVLSTVLTTRFASHLPAALRAVPGAQGEAIRRSVTSALSYAAHVPDPAVRAQLVDGTRDAFTSGSSVGLRIGAALLLLTAAVVTFQRPRRAGPPGLPLRPLRYASAAPRAGSAADSRVVRPRCAAPPK